MITFFDLFSGGGGAAQGATQAGLTPIGGVEFDPAIASIYTANHGDHITVADVLDTHPGMFPKSDWFHASPVCKSFSSAKTNGKELALDLACAKKVAEFIEAWRPDFFSLENVAAYGRSRSFGLIVDALHKAGYFPSWSILNAADYGVAQSRRRLILLAVRGGFVPPPPPPTPWMGWHEAIADLLPGLPESKLADWQVNALPEWVRESVLVHPTEQRSTPIIEGGNPCYTLTDSNVRKGLTRALLIENTGARSDRPLQIRTPDQPCWTIRAMGADGHWHRANALEQGRVVALDIPCLARLQSFPDSYAWSGRRSLDGVAIGNSVCPKFFEGVIRNVLGGGHAAGAAT
jgi:DNA (cytosine-5)-methyltransferase 1